MSSITPVARAAGPAWLLVFFAGAVLVRVGLGGVDGAASAPAAVVFAALLLGAVATARSRSGWAWTLGPRSIAVGLATGLAIVAPAWAHLGVPASLPVSAFPAWAALTVLVAGAEEAFLRGALFDVVSRWRGDNAAVLVAAVAFAAMHVPFYGWRAAPLDFAVGLALGAARLLAGTWTAPAIAHVGADLAGWWLL